MTGSNDKDASVPTGREEESRPAQPPMIPKKATPAPGKVGAIQQTSNKWKGLRMVGGLASVVGILGAALVGGFADVTGGSLMLVFAFLVVLLLGIGLSFGARIAGWLNHKQ